MDEDMDEVERLPDSQKHDYIRHAYGMFMHWFAFFGAVNFGVLGWLSKADGLNVPLAITVCIVLLLNNLVAPLGVQRFKAFLRQAGGEVARGSSAGAFPPVDLYCRIASIIISVMLINAGMWGAAIWQLSLLP